MAHTIFLLWLNIIWLIESSCALVICRYYCHSCVRPLAATLKASLIFPLPKHSFNGFSAIFVILLFAILSAVCGVWMLWTAARKLYIRCFMLSSATARSSIPSRLPPWQLKWLTRSLAMMIVIILDRLDHVVIFNKISLPRIIFCTACSCLFPSVTTLNANPLTIRSCKGAAWTSNRW
jgi:hypothetical protein